jgi:CBS domain-containing protein
MAGRRVDAILITDDKGSGQLKGIVTDKDLAFRCVAEGLDAHRTKIQQIMTQDPVYVSSEATVDIAINKMLQGHFRHLPVVDHNRIVGLLDITKVLLHIQSKIQNSWGKANALKSAFQEFQTTWQNFAATPEVQDWFQEWSDKMIEPNLLQVMNVNCPMPEVGLKSTVREAARVMKDTRQTAVLVYDPSHELAGIFTTKDICLRVLAPNDCDPRSTSVVRVMTPHPDCVGEDTTVRDALRKMHGTYVLLVVFLVNCKI